MCSDTYGVVIYQEQVLRLTNEVGHMGWEASNQLRKAMSKSYGAEFFNKYKVKFVKGATEKSGLNKETAEILWDQLVTFGSWAFNKSHSVSYGHLSYWCAYLKAHYPAEFYLATLQKENDDDVIKKLLREWVQADGEFVVLDHNKSDTNFSLHDGIIYGGFRNLKGIGEKQAEKLVGNRPFSDANSLRKTATKKVLGVLKSLDALDTLPIDNSHQVNLFANDEELGFDDFGDIEKQGDIIEIAPWADLYPIGDKYDEFVANNNLEITNVEDIKETTTDVVCVVKIKHLNLRSIRETSVTQQRGKSVKNAHLDKFLNIYAEDDTETIILGISRYNYPKFGNKLFDHGIGTIVCIQGKKVRGFRKISVNNLKILKSANNFKENQEKYQESERQYA
jgi:DNA polymerase III alpha subunit